MTVRHWRIALIVWMAVIFVASSGLFSSENTEKVLVFEFLNYAVRKGAHLGVYGVLTFLWFRSLWTVRDRFLRCLVWSVVLSIAYGALDEYHQSFVPSRLGIWTDVVWDGAGAVLMALALWGVWQWGSARMQALVLGPTAQVENMASGKR